LSLGLFQIFNFNQEKLTLTKEEKEGWLKKARSITKGILKGKEYNLPKDVSESQRIFYEYVVAVSFYRKGIAPLKGVGKGDALVTSLIEAISQVIKSGRLKLEDLDKIRIKIDIFQDWERLFIPTYLFFKLRIKPGIDGIGIKKGNKWAYILPSEMIERGIGRREFWMSIKSLQQLEGKGKLKFYRFRTLSFIDVSPGVSRSVDVYRANILLSGMKKRDLLNASLRGGEWLVRHQRKDGRWWYIYYPVTNSYSYDYNILRHAGTIYSLFQLYEVTYQKQFLKAAKQGLDFLLKQVVITREKGNEIAYVSYNNKVKLGGTALTLLALLELQKIEEHNGYLKLIEKLGNFILSMQKDDGSFYSYYPYSFSQRKSVYYPGEATLALIRLYNFDHKKKWLHAAEKSARYLILKRWRYMGIDIFIPHDAWLMQALSELYMITKNKIYANYCFKMADFMVAYQYRANDNCPPDYIGGWLDFSTTPGVTPAAYRTEGLIGACKLAKFMNLSTKRYTNAVLLSANFLRQQQFREENSYYLPYPEKAKGGFRESLINHEIRIDYVQHAISSLLGVRDVIE